MTGDEYVLAIDLGTSGPKVGLVTEDGTVAVWRQTSTALSLLDGGGAEQDPDDWWRAISSAVRGVLTDRAGATVAAVACTSQWSGTVPMTRNGTANGPAVIWMDSRGEDLIADRVGGPISFEGYAPHKLARWLRLTGGAPGRSGKDPIAHILWIEANRPEIARNTAVYLEPKDYLGFRLTGEIAAGFDSIALHWVTDNREVDHVRYDDRLVAMAGLDRSKLPPLRSPRGVLGALTPQAAADLGLEPGIPVVMGTPDLHSAAIGAGATEEGLLHLYLGTSSWIGGHVSFKKTDILHNIASLPSALPGRWIIANEQETAGACLTYLVENLGFGPSDTSEHPYQALDRIAERVPPGSHGVVFTPWLYGERTPVEDASVRASFFNQSLDTTRADLVRAVFEGVALNSRWLLKYVERFIGGRADGIPIVGGGANSTVWCQIHADVLNRTVYRVADPVLVNVRGVGLLGWLSLGRIAVADLARRPPVAEVHRPDAAATRRYDRIFEQFVKLYRVNRKVHAALNRRGEEAT